MDLNKNGNVLPTPYSNALGGNTAVYESNNLPIKGGARRNKNKKTKKNVTRNNRTKRQRRLTHKCIQRKYKALFKKKTRKMRFST